MVSVTISKNDKIMAKNVNLLSDPISKSVGLMFSNKKNVILVADNENIWDTSIHTFFCKPLLVVWINSKHIVVDVKKTIPWRFYAPKAPAKYVFETRKMNLRVKIGDKLKFKF